jgi:MoxR-vWA-beta-propeller ternary system domain bpX4
MQQDEGEQPSQSYSDLAIFIQSLANEGRAAVSADPSDIDDADAVPLLRELDGFARDGLALELPAFSPNAALWAARLVHQLCRFVVCRDIPEEQINAACNAACPEPRGPETDWSVDLTLHHLPNLFRFARQLSNADPLVEQMRKIAAEWPLSSVGINGLENLRIDSFVEHPALRRLYADRIIAASDTSRPGDLRLDDRLRADLCVHRELAPAIAASVFKNS